MATPPRRGTGDELDDASPAPTPPPGAVRITEVPGRATSPAPVTAGSATGDTPHRRSAPPPAEQQRNEALHASARLGATVAIVVVLTTMLAQDLRGGSGAGVTRFHGAPDDDIAAVDGATSVPVNTPSSGGPKPAGHASQRPAAQGGQRVTKPPPSPRPSDARSGVGGSATANVDWYFPRRFRRDAAAPPAALAQVFPHDGVGLLSGPGITVDTDVVASFGATASRPLGDVLPCASESASRSAEQRFDVLLAPAGCFGSPLGGRPCAEVGDTACRLGEALATVAGRCGTEVIGALLGDNFYPNGIRRATDPRFDHELHEKFFRHRALQVPWYVATGNHDRRPEAQRRFGNATAAAAARSRSRHSSGNGGYVPPADSEVPPPGVPGHPFAHMPALHYASPVHGPPGATVQFFVVDTHWGFAANDAHMADEAAWLDAQLRRSTATWKVVASHEPIWGHMGFGHGRGLAQHVHPVLVRHKVPLYVCAHQHSVALSRAPGGYYQLVSAGFADNLHAVVQPRRPFGHFHAGRGATVVGFNATHATVAAFAADRSALFAHAIDRAATLAALDELEDDGDAAATTVRVPIADLAGAAPLREPQTEALRRLVAAASAKAGDAAAVTVRVPLAAELEGEVAAAGFARHGFADLNAAAAAAVTSRGGARNVSIWALGRSFCDALLPAVPARHKCSWPPP